MVCAVLCYWVVNDGIMFLVSSFLVAPVIGESFEELSISRATSRTLFLRIQKVSMIKHHFAG